MFSRRSTSSPSIAHLPLAAIIALSLAAPKPANANSDLGLVVRDSLIEKAAAQLISANTDKNGVLSRKLKTVDEEIEDLDLIKLPDLAKTYGTNFFGIDDKKDFDLTLRYFDAQFSVKPKVADVTFEKVFRDRAEVSFTVELDDVSILIPKLWIKEHGFSNQYSSEEPQCLKEMKKHPFFKDRVYGEIRNIRLNEVKSKRDAPPLRVKVVAEVDFAAGPKKKQIKIKSTEHNVNEVIGKHYALDFSKINLPPMKLEVNGNCFDIDQKPIEDWIRQDLEKIKVLLIKSIMNGLVTGGVKDANKLLAKFRFSPEVEINRGRDPITQLHDFMPIALAGSYDLRTNKPIHPRDATTVAPNFRNMPMPKPKEEKPLDAFKKILDSFFMLRYSIGLHHLDDHSKSEFAAFITEALSINGHTGSPENPEIKIPNFGAMQETQSGDFVLAISTGMLKDKFSIIQRIRLLEKQFFPKGIQLSNKGVELHRLNDKTLSVVANTVIDLSDMEGFGPWLGNVIEHIPLIAKTKGVLNIPIQINITPMIAQSKSGTKYLRAQLEMSPNYDMTSFGGRSNVSDATGIVEHFVRGELDDLRKTINSTQSFVPISEVERLSGFTPEWIKLSPQGDIWMGASLKSIKTLLPNLKIDF